jgi:hypothetical protein
LQALNRRNGGEIMGESVTLGNLLYFIKAKNEEFKKGMTEVEDKFESVNKKAQDNSKKMKAWGLAITGISVGVVTALQLMTKSTAEGVEKLEKYSIQTGMSTQQLQKWGYAAKLNKASLDQLAQGLVFLARSIRSADLESEAAKQAFKQLKIEFDDGKGGFRDMGDILDDIRDRFSKMANGAEKTALATKLFGRGAADLVPVLSLSREQLDELSQEAERLGIILTTDNIAQFAKYKDSLEAVEEGMSGLKMQISAAVLPAMQDMISMVKDAIVWFNQLPEPIKKAIPQLALFAATVGAIVGPTMLVVGAWSKLKAIIVGTDFAFGLQALLSGTKYVSTAEAVGFLAKSFTPFLVGGVIIAGLSVIADLMNQIKENAKNAKIADLNLSKATKEELTQAIEYWQKTLDRMNRTKSELEKKIKEDSSKPQYAPNLGMTPMSGVSAQTVTVGQTSKRNKDALTKLQNDIANVQKKLAEANKWLNYVPEPPGSGNGNLDTEKFQKSMSDYEEFITTKLSIEEQARIDLIADAQEKELAILEQNYWAKLAEASKYEADTTDITAKYEQERDAIKQKYADQEKQRNADLQSEIIQMTGTKEEQEEDYIKRHKEQMERDGYNFQQIEDWKAAYHKQKLAEQTQDEADFFSDIILRHKTLEDAWKELMERLVREYIYNYLMKIKQAESSSSGNNSDGSNDVGTWTAIIGAIGSIFGYSKGGIVPALAGGGLIPAATNGMVVPPSFGTDTVISALTPKEMVLPVDLSEGIQNLIKQGTQPQVINNYNTQVQAIDEQSTAQFFYKNRDMVTGIVNNNINKGGTLRR